MKLRALLILPVFAVLAGCAGTPAGDLIAGPEKLATQDDAYCSSIGAAKGTTQYTDCRLRVTQMREQKHSAERSAVFNRDAGCKGVDGENLCD